MKTKISPNRFQKSLKPGLAVVVLLTSILLSTGQELAFAPLGQRLALAQTGPPPPPVPTTVAPPSGAGVAEPEVPAVPPDGVPPVVGKGIIAIIPTAIKAETVSLLNFILSSNCSSTAIVSTDPRREVVIRFQELAPDEIPKQLPASITRLLFVFTFDLYALPPPAEKMRGDSLEIFLGTCPLPVVEPETAALLRYDEMTQQYQFPPQQFDPVSRILRAELPEASIFVVATTLNQDLAQTPPIPTPVIPAGLPRTGGAGGPSPFLWGLGGVAAGLGLVFGFWRWWVIRHGCRGG